MPYRPYVPYARTMNAKQMTGVYETIAPSGYEGHIGHVPQGPALLFGLFLDHFDAPISDRTDETDPHLPDDNAREFAAMSRLRIR